MIGMSEQDREDSNKQAVLLTCPICDDQRPYCGARDAELGEARLQIGIISHLDSAHELEMTERGAAVMTCLDNREITNISANHCKHTSNRGWDTYV